MEKSTYIKRNFITITALSKIYKGIFSVDMLRYMSSNDPEFMKCVYRFSKNKVLIDLNLFEKWIESKRQS